MVLFAPAMTAPLGYDEELYVGGAYFARTLSVYRDFVSVQPPLYTWICLQYLTWSATGTC